MSPWRQALIQPRKCKIASRVETIARTGRYVVWPTLERPALYPATVLIVEDDPVILMTAAHMLRQAGFRTLEADTADAAAELLKAHAGEVRLVFSDIETPGLLDGLKLARVIDDSWPAMPVVLTSGRVTPLDGSLPPGARFLTKPYDIVKVVRLIRDLIEG